MSYWDYLIGPTGTVLPLSDLGASVSGLSDIPVQYAATRGYRQSGETLNDFHLEPRTLTITWQQAADRRQVQALRDQVTALLTPDQAMLSGERQTRYVNRNRLQGFVTFRRVFANGSVREIQGVVESGLSLEDFFDRTGYFASLTLRCPDPTFVDLLHFTQVQLSGSAVDAFVSPAAAPDDFWTGGYSAVSGTLAVLGTWRAYPLIQVIGPCSSLTLTNQTTGATLTITQPIYLWQSVQIDLTPGNQSVWYIPGDVPSSDWWQNWLDAVDGNLVDWALEPGSNVVVGSGSGITTDTHIWFNYYPRFAAL